MNLFDFIKKTISPSCIIFAIITSLYILFVGMMNPEDEEILLEATRIFLFLLFSFIFSIAHSLLQFKAIPSVIRYILHYTITAFAVAIAILYPANPEQSDTAFMVVGLSLFTVLYAIILIAIAIVKAIIARKKDKEIIYLKKFSK